MAICKEIGEQLDIGMKPKPAGMPPHLMMLMRRLRDEPLSRPPRLIRSNHGACLLNQVGPFSRNTFSWGSNSTDSGAAIQQERLFGARFEREDAYDGSAVLNLPCDQLCEFSRSGA